MRMENPLLYLITSRSPGKSLPFKREIPGERQGQNQTQGTANSNAYKDLAGDILCVLSHFSHVGLRNPINCSLPGSPVHGILQARIWEWVPFPFSRGSSWPRDRSSSPAFQVDSLPSEPPGKPWQVSKESQRRLWWPNDHMPHPQQLCLDHCCHVERLAQGSQLSDLYREDQKPYFFLIKFSKWKNSVGVKWNFSINCIWFLSHQF